MRPAGQCRLVLLAALQSGAVGTFDVLARHAGVPEREARYTLANLRRERVIDAQHQHRAGAAQPQRLRVIYHQAAANDAHIALDALSFARQVWH